MKFKTDRIINITFCLSVCFLIAAVLTRLIWDIDTTPKAPPCPIGLAEHFMLEKSTGQEQIP